MKVSIEFKEIIKAHLDQRAASDELFAETYKKENKTIEECCNYVVKRAKEGKCEGYADAEVFDWAVHYYDEDDIKNIKAESGKVIINRAVELSAQDLAQAKKEAMDLAIAEAKEDAKKAIQGTIKLSEEDLKDVKQMAIDKIVDHQREVITQKAKPVKKEQAKPVQQIGLF